MKGLSDTNVSHFSDPSSPVSSQWFVGKVVQEMTLAEEANPLFMFVVPGAAARRAMGWGDGRLVQVVFLEDRADISFAKVVLN